MQHLRMILGTAKRFWGPSVVSLFAVFAAPQAHAAPIKVLSDSSHAFSSIIQAIDSLVGTGHIGTDFIVHYTHPEASGFTADVNDALNAGATYYDQNSNPVASQAPYQLFTTSATGYSGDTMTEYNLSATHDIVHNYAYSGSPAPLPAGTFPPAFHIALGGNAGPGVEFSLGTDCTTFSFNCNSFSDQTATLAGIEAVLRYNHPTWNWFDVKASLRQTASQWNTGYRTGYDGADAFYGFGLTDYAAANALADNQLFLQPPEVKLTGTGPITFEVYPFKQSRRVKEVLFEFSSAPSFHSGELSLSDIADLGGVKVSEYSGATALQLTPVYVALSNAYLVWFTADATDDNTAHFSRIDSYNVIGPVSQSAVGSSLAPALYTLSPTVVSIAFDKSHHKLYGSDVDNSRIVRMDSGTGGTTLGGNQEYFGSSGSGAGQFNNPGELAFDEANNRLYILDKSNYRVVAMDSGSGGTTFGANWQAFGSYGSATGQFKAPRSLDIDGSDNKLYVIDATNHCINQMDSGTGGTTFGANWQAFGTNGTGVNQFSGPTGLFFEAKSNSLYVTDSLAHRIDRIDAGTGGTTLGANWQAFGSSGSGTGQFGTFSGVFVDSVHDRIYVNEGNNARIVAVDSGTGGTTLGSNWKVVADLIDFFERGYSKLLSSNRLIFDADSGAFYIPYRKGANDGYLARIIPAQRSVMQLQNNVTIQNQVFDCSSGYRLGAYVSGYLSGTAINNATFINCSAGGALLRSRLSSAKNLAFIDTPMAVIDEAGGYSATTSFNDSADGDAHVDASGHPLYDSPLIDAGSAVSGRTTDAVGNPFYGTPDIGAYEYQPPHTIGTDGIDIAAGARIYGDGKFRDRGTVSSSSASLSITPQAGSFPSYGSTAQRPAWMDVSSITWSNTGNRHKRWTESSDTIGSASTLHIVGDLTPNTPYVVSVDDTAGANITGAGSTVCASSICTSDGSGKISFMYSGGYSTHTFDVVQDTAAPVLAITSPTNGTTVSGDDTITFTDSETTDPECSLDGSTWDSCTSGSTSFADLPSWAGISESASLTLSLRDTDLSGNTGTASADHLTKADTQAPVRSDGAPFGALSSGTTSTTLSLTTKEDATCKYDTVSGTAYASMAHTFTTTGATSHSASVSSLSDGNTYSYFVRCQDGSGNADDTDYLIAFSVDASATAGPDNDRKEEKSGSPRVTLSGVKVSAASASITVAWKTNRNADSSIRYGTDKGNLIGRQKKSSKVKKHQLTISNLRPNTTYYFRVRSASGSKDDSSRIHMIRTLPVSIGR